ncbi:hypothetical protein C8R46DRAFT_1354546 [Mycena filopes]|nr:hypothetical protein C8R46DRAFT_1354546 [Mycena filopes]
MHSINTLNVLISFFRKALSESPPFLDTNPVPRPRFMPGTRTKRPNGTRRSRSAKKKKATAEPFPPPPCPALAGFPHFQLPPMQVPPGRKLLNTPTPYKGVFPNDPGVSLEDLKDAPILPWRCIAFLHCTQLISRTLLAQRVYTTSPTLAELVAAFSELRSIVAQSGIIPTDLTPLVHSWAAPSRLDALPPLILADRKQGAEESRFVTCVFTAGLRLRALLTTVVDPACYEAVAKLVNYVDSVLNFTYAFVFLTD